MYLALILFRLLQLRFHFIYSFSEKKAMHYQDQMCVTNNHKTPQLCILKRTIKQNFRTVTKPRRVKTCLCDSHTRKNNDNPVGLFSMTGTTHVSSTE